MKTTKNLLALALFILVVNPLAAFGPKEAISQQKEKASMNMEKLMQTESDLLEDYLEDVQTDASKTEPTMEVSIYLADGKTVFAGEKSNAVDLLDQSAFLFEYGNHEYYLINQ